MSGRAFSPFCNIPALTTRDARCIIGASKREANAMKQFRSGMFFFFTFNQVMG